MNVHNLSPMFARPNFYKNKITKLTFQINKSGHYVDHIFLLQKIHKLKGSNNQTNLFHTNTQVITE